MIGLTADQLMKVFGEAIRRNLAMMELEDEAVAAGESPEMAELFATPGLRELGLDTRTLLNIAMVVKAFMDTIEANNRVVEQSLA